MILMHPRQVGSVRQVTEERVDVALNRSTLQVRADLADHYGWSCRPPGPTREPGRVTTYETPSHHARCAIEAKRGDALERLRNNPPDEEDPPEQTITTTFTPHVFKTTPE